MFLHVLPVETKMSRKFLVNPDKWSMGKLTYNENGKPLSQTKDWLSFSEKIYEDFQKNPKKYQDIDIQFIDVLPTDIVLVTSYGRGDMYAIIRGDKIIYDGFEDLYVSSVKNFKFT